MKPHYLLKIFGSAQIVNLRKNEEYQFDIDLVELADSKFKLLVTNGLREFKQAVNSDNEDLERIELYFCLPEYFNLEQNSWPIEWLECIARVPQKNKTWFGHGDTIPAGNPPVEVDPQFKANHFILSRPIHLSETFSANRLGNYSFLAVIPIFQREVDYKLKNSHTMLFNLFEKKKITEELDLYREDVRKKRFKIF